MTLQQTAYAACEAAIHAKIQQREKQGWSRNIGAGFVLEDIQSVFPRGEHEATVTFAGHIQTFKLNDLNLRELDAVRSWLFKRI